VGLPGAIIGRSSSSAPRGRTNVTVTQISVKHALYRF